MARPERTCVGCGARATRAALLRFVAGNGGRLRCDPLGRAPGRGVYTCAARACVAAASKRGFARGLRRRVVVGDISAVARAEIGQQGDELVRQMLADGRLRGDEERALGARLRWRGRHYALARPGAAPQLAQLSKWLRVFGSDEDADTLATVEVRA